MRLWFFIFVLLAVGVRAEPASTNSSSLQKVVRQYALTSANDFQQRDPLDWRLLASNDGGRTWITLDVRVGELFSERHQRRVFQLANTNAFNAYRLQVDRVREPKAANSVQLAELELLGARDVDSDPTPIASDVVTAQGDNPPLETATHLFDGLIETKWLDRPTNRETCASWVQWQYHRPSDIWITNVSQLVALRSRAAEGHEVRLRAIFAGTPREGFVEVLDETGVLELPARSEFLKCRPGQRVRIEGASALVEGQPTVRVGKITIEDPRASEVPIQISIEQPLADGVDFLWADVVGEIRRVQEADGIISFELEENGRFLTVRMRKNDSSEEVLKQMNFVRVRGICRAAFDAGGNWEAASLWACGPDAITRVDDANDTQRSVSGSGRKRGSNVQPGITRIGDIREMNQQQLASRPHVTVRGVITGLLGAFVQDDTGGIQVAFKAEDSRRLKQLGEYVEVEGWLGLSDAFTPIISADRVTSLGAGKLPRPNQPEWDSLASGRNDALWLELEGVVRTTDGAHLLMSCDGRQVTASLATAAAPRVNELVDALVRIRGVAVAALDDWGRMRGVHVLIPSLDFVEVRRRPDPPFSRPVQPIRSLLKAGGAGSHSHRVRVEGVLTLQDGQRLFLQDDSGAAMAIFKQEVVLDSQFGRSQWSFWRTPPTPGSQDDIKRFNPGDLVEVVGFQESHGYSPVLTEALVRRVGSTGKVNVRKITDEGFTDWKIDSMLVKIEGELVGQQLRGEQVVLELLTHGRTLQAFMPSGVELDDLAPGTKLMVTGVWQMDPAPYAELGRSVGAVRVLTRSAADLQILSRPSWWTVRRALMVIGGMAFVLMAALVWITQLRRKVEQRSAQLSAEIHLREQMERQRALEEERSRIARDLHDDLGAALTQIRFLSAVESRDETVPTGTRSRLEQVSEKSLQLVASLDEIVWAINPANDSLPNLANYLCHVAEELLASTPIRCRLDVQETLPAIALTSEVRHNVCLAVREALNNVAKHSGATEARLKLRLNDGLLEIAVEDNGQGFDATANVEAGEGLRNMRQRMEAIGGSFVCEARNGSGVICRMALSLRSEQENGRNMEIKT